MHNYLYGSFSGVGKEYLLLLYLFFDGRIKEVSAIFSLFKKVRKVLLSVFAFVYECLQMFVEYVLFFICKNKFSLYFKMF